MKFLKLINLEKKQVDKKIHRILDLSILWGIFGPTKTKRENKKPVSKSGGSEISQGAKYLHK